MQPRVFIACTVFVILKKREKEKNPRGEAQAHKYVARYIVGDISDLRYKHTNDLGTSYMIMRCIAFFTVDLLISFVINVHNMLIYVYKRLATLFDLSKFKVYLLQDAWVGKQGGGHLLEAPLLVTLVFNK